MLKRPTFPRTCLTAAAALLVAILGGIAGVEGGLEALVAVDRTGSSSVTVTSSW